MDVETIAILVGLLLVLVLLLVVGFAALAL